MLPCVKGALNCADDDNTDFNSYRSDIVYGEASSFQRDILLNEFHKKELQMFGDRYQVKKGTVLI